VNAADRRVADLAHPTATAPHPEMLALEAPPALPLFGNAVAHVKWSFAASALTLLLQSAYTATVSRVVAAEAFGLVALGAVLLRFVSYFAQLGLGSAVVQRPMLDEGDIRVAFTASTLLGIVIFAVAWLLAPIAAPLFSDDPDLIAVSRALSATFLFSGASATAQAVLRRGLRFRVLALVDVAAFAIGYLLIGLPLALRGAEVWSLAAAALATTAVTTFLHLLFARHSMRPLSDRSRLRALLSFGGGVSIIGFLEFIGSTLDTLAVGRFGGTAALGNYSRATAVVTPVERFATATSAVMYPNFARLGQDRARAAKAYLSGFALISAMILPPAAFLAAAAPNVVRILLGDEWGLAAVLLPAIALAVAINLLSRYCGAVCEALGFLKGKLIIQAVHIAVVAGIVATTVARFDSDPRGFAFAWLGGEAVRQVLYTAWLKRIFAIPFRHAAVPTAEACLLAVLPAMAVLLTSRALTLAPALELGVSAFSASVVLAVTYASWPKLTVRREVRDRHILSAVLGVGRPKAGHVAA
jgi:O-antigen/teichoic acid export membrane protein